MAGVGAAWAADGDAQTIKSRNTEMSRARAARLPRSVADQAVVGGWPLYRTERGQEAFNDAMAALAATEGNAPAPNAFRGCGELACRLSLPAIDREGWLAAGRLWVSPSQYVLIVHSPRARRAGSYRRRSFRSMRVLVFHEFHNSSRNTDPYDTISSHSGSVFVPLYMSKTGTDAQGRHFVVVVQVAPYDVVSIHASNRGSAGPGMEVAKNMADEMEPLQGAAGIVIATMIKRTAPHLQVVNHRGAEGLEMLKAYERHVARAGGPQKARPVALPFVPAAANRVATATGGLGAMIRQGAGSAPLTLAERSFVPRGRRVHIDARARRNWRQVAQATPRDDGQAEPELIEPIRQALPRACQMAAAGGGFRSCGDATGGRR